MYAMNMAFVERYGINHLPAKWRDSQGIYILFSHLQPGHKFEAYVGQTTKGFHQRLLRHDNERYFWQTAILIRRTSADGFSSLQLNALEGKLRDILDASPNVTVHNGHPTGDPTLKDSDRPFIDAMTLSIMRVMFMRGYRNQHMGAEADRMQEAISGTVPEIKHDSDAYNKFLPLKAWRLQKAREEGISAFIVFTNQVLLQIIEAKPSTIEELRAVHGIGQNKCDKYGEEVLQILNT
jgi:superfamily II DNA helicase RecQ